MKNKYLKIIIFAYFSWLIYCSPLLICAPIIGIRYGISELLDSLKFAFVGLPFALFYALAGILIINNPVAIYCIMLLLIYFIPLHIWWRRQTIPRAFMLSMLFMLAGPGIDFFMGWLMPRHSRLGVVILPVTCIFYILLYKLNNWQKKHYPDNRLANKIRAILKYPCIRT